MGDIIRIGIDTSKSVFQLHGVDEAEKPILRNKLRRSQFLEFFSKLERTKIGMEACGASHHWARSLTLWDTRLFWYRRNMQKHM